MPDGSRHAQSAFTRLRSHVEFLLKYGVQRGLEGRQMDDPEARRALPRVFPVSGFEPRRESSFSCCLRLDDMAALYQACKSAGLPEQCWGWPRLHPPKEEDSGLTIAYMIDPDGTLIRLIQN